MQEDSILTTIKKLLGIDESFTMFDMEVTVGINSAFATLQDLGVGPGDGFEIHGSQSKWKEFITDKRLNSVITFVYYSTKLGFDPPATSYAISAMEKQIEELKWRLNVYAETGGLND